jgi:hypothetical protein
MSKLRYGELKLKPNAVLPFTGLTQEEFELLVPEYEKAFQTHMSKWRLDGKPRTKRSYTTYENCPLPTTEDRLLFVLSYVKGNPLQSHHGVLFGMGQSKTNSWLHILLPVLRATLRNLGAAPARSVQELAERLAEATVATDENSPLSDPALPLFAMTAPSAELNVPKLRLNRRLAIAARKEPIP